MHYDRAQFGLNADGSLYIELHHGGAPGCPNTSQTELTLNVDSPAPTSTDPIGVDQGAGSVFWDFKGDFWDELRPPTRTALTITPVAANITNGADAFYAFDVHAEFESGIVVDGHVYASRCTGMDE